MELIFEATAGDAAEATGIALLDADVTDGLEMAEEPAALSELNGVVAEIKAVVLGLR